MFRSLFLAGFEGSTGINRHGEWFDHVVATGHQARVDEDYRNVSLLGLHGAREAVRWPLIDRRGRYDFSSLQPFIAAAQRNRVGVVWDLFHYGFPRDADPWSNDFVKRFADYAQAAARFIVSRVEPPYAFTPVNEPSFMAYAAGEKALFAPHGSGRGFELKVILARAAIAAIDAIRSVCPSARFVNADPLCRVVAPRRRPDLAEEARDFNERLVFQSWDMLCGRLYPELGGSADHLDVVGINYYWTNQWELQGADGEDGVVPPLADDDPRRASLFDMVRAVHERYGQEVMITETSHVGDNRGPWLQEVIQLSEDLLASGVPLRGVCLYPILGMPEWHDRRVWTPMGLWDPNMPEEPSGARVVCQPMAAALGRRERVEAMYRWARVKQRRTLLRAPTREKRQAWG